MEIDIAGLEELEDKDRDGIEEIIYKVLNAADLDKYSINICLVDEETITGLNLSFRKKNKITDVLSFPVPEMERSFPHTKNLLGDVIICVEQARAQAEEWGHTLPEEIAVLVAHGLFHLLGYDHERSPDEADIQMQGEMHLLELAGFSPELCLVGRGSSPELSSSIQN